MSGLDPAVGGWGAAKSLQKVSLSGMNRAAQGIVNASAPRLYFLSAANIMSDGLTNRRTSSTNAHFALVTNFGCGVSWVMGFLWIVLGRCYLHLEFSSSFVVASGKAGSSRRT